MYWFVTHADLRTTPTCGDLGASVVESQGEYKRVGGITLSPTVAQAMEAERTAIMKEAGL